MTSRLLLLAALFCFTSANATAPKTAAPEPTLPTPEYLPPLARAVLHKRMQRHGRDQSRLVLAVTLLQPTS